jgi:NDP-sugar pyrophosphorylase family protein
MEQVTGYIEKPTLHYPVSMGIYVYDESVLGYIKKGEYSRLSVFGAKTRFCWQISQRLE